MVPALRELQELGTPKPATLFVYKNPRYSSITGAYLLFI
jgi:hypothetical protein